MPRVSIVIPTYNRADLLLHTLHSALEQTYANREIIVIDNASIDETPALMTQFDGRVRYIRKPVNKGLVDSYNMGFREAAGEFILLLDSDDTIHPTMIAKQVAYLDQHPKMDLVRVGGFYVDAEGGKIGRVRLAPTGPGRQLLSSLVFGNFELCGSILYRKSVIERIGLYDENLPVYEDWDYSLRMAMQNIHFGFIPEPLFFYRFHAGNSMRKVQAVEAASDIILDKLFADPGLPPAAKSLRQQAFAQAHLFLAFSYYALQSPADAQHSLLRAWHEHPHWQTNGASMLDAMLDYSLYMHMVDLEHFAGYVMDNLPPQLAALRTHEASFVSRVQLQQAFHFYDRGEVEAGMARFQQALVTDAALVSRCNDFALLLRKYALQAISDPPEQFIRIVLNNLPAPARPLRNVRNIVAADLELVAAYAVMNDDKRKMAQHLTNALRLRPTLAGRRGVMAPLMRTLIPPLEQA